MELLDGEGLGRRQRLHGRWGKQRSEIDQQIVAYEPGRMLAWRHEAERLDGKPAPRFAAETRFQMDLQADGEGTLVRLASDQTPVGWPQGLLLRAMAGAQVGRLLDRSLQRLDELATAGPGAGGRG
jgi:hypothetical protein